MLLTRRFIAITVVNFFAACNLGAFYLFPLFLADRGGTPADIGYIMGAFPLASVLSRPLMSELIDRLGRKWSYALASLTMIMASLAYLAFSGGLGDFYWPLLLVRAIHGVSAGLTFTAGFTYAADIIPENRMNEGIGLFGTSGLLGFAIGPVMAEIIIRNLGFSAYFLFAAILPAIGVLLLLPLPETYVHDRSQKGGAFLTVLRQPKIITVSVLVLIMGIGVASTSGFVSLLAQSRGILLVSPYFLAYSGAAVATRLLGGRLADIVGESRVVPPALVVCGIGLIILVFANAVQYLVLAGLISGAAHGLLYPCLSTMAIRNETAGHRAKILAIVTGSFDAGVFAGSIGLGQVGKYLGFPAIFLIAGLAFFLGVGIFLARPGSRRT
jgi:MFS family permease